MLNSRLEPLPFDTILVLGAAQLLDGSPGPAIERRVRHAVACYRDGMALRLVMVGGCTATAVPEAETMASVARAAGVPAEAIHCELESTRTLENAARCREMMVAEGWRRALLVTDSFHMPRALYTFRAFGLEVTPAPVPALRTAATLAAVVRETVARICYLWWVRRYFTETR